METTGKNEHFQFNFRKLEFESTNPGIETRKTCWLIGGFIIVILILVITATVLVKPNILAARAVQKSTQWFTLIRNSSP